MKTNRFELKDFRLNEILSMLTPYSGPSLSEELNRVWTGEARTVKFGNRFSVDLTPEDVKENPEFRPNEWNPTKSWNIPKNVDLMFSIQENESGKEIARLRGHGKEIPPANLEPVKHGLIVAQQLMEYAYEHERQALINVLKHNTHENIAENPGLREAHDRFILGKHYEQVRQWELEDDAFLGELQATGKFKEQAEEAK